LASPEPPSLIEYPSLFPIKVMGANAPGFEQAMIDIAMRFDPAYDRASLQVRPSSGGKYLGLTLEITATSREQLDALYRALSSHPLVKVVL
jgi:putative lipoic acid-binding regulatory protein